MRVFCEMCGDMVYEAASHLCASLTCSSIICEKCGETDITFVYLCENHIAGECLECGVRACSAKAIVGCEECGVCASCARKGDLSNVGFCDSCDTVTSCTACGESLGGWGKDPELCAKCVKFIEVEGFTPFTHDDEDFAASLNFYAWKTGHPSGVNPDHFDASQGIAEPMPILPKVPAKGQLVLARSTDLPPDSQVIYTAWGDIRMRRMPQNYGGSGGGSAKYTPSRNISASVTKSGTRIVETTHVCVPAGNGAQKCTTTKTVYTKKN